VLAQILATLLEKVHYTSFSSAAVLTTAIRDQYTDTTIRMDPDYDTILIRVRACDVVHVGLLEAENDYDGAMYEISIGENNNANIVLR